MLFCANKVPILCVWFGRVEVEVFGELVKGGSDLGIYLLLFLLFFGWVGGTCFFHELLVLFFDNYSLSRFDGLISVGPNYHTFGDIFFQFRISKKLRNSGINLCVDVENFFEASLCIDWH